MLDAAKLLSICKTTLYRMIAEGEITPINVRGHKRIPRAEVERLLGAAIPELKPKPAAKPELAAAVIRAQRTNSDAALTRLGEKLTAALASRAKTLDAPLKDGDDEDARYERLSAPIDELQERIARIPSMTFEGIIVRAQALKAVFPDCAVLEPDARSSYAIRAASGIIEDLLALAS